MHGHRRPLCKYNLQTLRATINKWEFLKLKSFCKAKDIVTQTKQQPHEWDKIFTLDREFTSKICEELKKLDIKLPNNPIKNWATDLKREFSTEEL